MMEEQKNNTVTSYVLDTAYGPQRDLTKTYGERITQSMDRNSLPYDFNGGRTRPTVIDSGVGGESLVQNYCQMLSPDNNRET